MNKTIDDIAQEHVGQEISLVGNGPTLVKMPGPQDFFGRYIQYVRDREAGGTKDINEYGAPLTNVSRLAGHPRKHWTVNGGWSYHPESNLGFMLDDHSFHRDETHPQAAWYDNLIKNTKIPVMTSRAYPAYPALIEYPLKEIVKFYKTKRFDETIDYMLALAGYFGVKKIFVLGCDYQLHDRFPGERAGTEYWLGRIEQLGIEIDTTPSQHLMKPSAREPMYSDAFYGFARNNPVVNDPEILEIISKVNY